jgi:hypothetical protein
MFTSHLAVSNDVGMKIDTNSIVNVAYNGNASNTDGAVNGVVNYKVLVLIKNYIEQFTVKISYRIRSN